MQNQGRHIEKSTGPQNGQEKKKNKPGTPGEEHKTRKGDCKEKPRWTAHGIISRVEGRRDSDRIRNDWSNRALGTKKILRGAGDRDLYTGTKREEKS